MTEEKNSKFNELVKPFLVLVGICLVVSVLLGYTNRVTAPVIEANALAQAEATRKAVLEGATGFTEVRLDEAKLKELGIASAYKEKSGLGYVITSSNKGYGGFVTVTVGIGPDGKVLKVSADVSTETSGIGSKAGDADYTAKYVGLTGSADSVDTISGATYSSTAVKKGVSAALAAFDTVKGA